MIHLYYVLMKNNIGNKKESCLLIKNGYITVNGFKIDDPYTEIKDTDMIIYNGKILDSSPIVYYMLNKPKGYISANKDDKPCVLDLFERKDLSIAGRLDKDTTGLMILSNDKSLIKKITLPQYHLKKMYLVETLKKISKQDINKCKEGIIIDNNVICRPAVMSIINDYHCYITLTEGKYHQVKKMFLSMNNQVLSLKRVKIGEIDLDDKLKEGEYRKLTKEEVFSLKQYVE